MLLFGFAIVVDLCSSSYGYETEIVFRISYLSLDLAGSGYSYICSGAFRFFRTELGFRQLMIQRATACLQRATAMRAGCALPQARRIVGAAAARAGDCVYICLRWRLRFAHHDKHV